MGPPSRRRRLVRLVSFSVRPTYYLLPIFSPSFISPAYLSLLPRDRVGRIHPHASPTCIRICTHQHLHSALGPVCEVAAACACNYSAYKHLSTGHCCSATSCRFHVVSISPRSPHLFEDVVLSKGSPADQDIVTGRGWFGILTIALLLSAPLGGP
jgi:hypothetical protein